VAWLAGEFTVAGSLVMCHLLVSYHVRRGRLDAGDRNGMDAR
jgi:hypothetical protein